MYGSRKMPLLQPVDSFAALRYSDPRVFTTDGALIGYVTEMQMEWNRNGSRRAVLTLNDAQEMLMNERSSHFDGVNKSVDQLARELKSAKKAAKAERKKATRRREAELLRRMLRDAAVDTYKEIAEDTRLETTDRLVAAQRLLEMASNGLPALGEF